MSRERIKLSIRSDFDSIDPLSAFPPIFCKHFPDVQNNFTHVVVTFASIYHIQIRAARAWHAQCLPAVDNRAEKQQRVENNFFLCLLPIRSQTYRKMHDKRRQRLMTTVHPLQINKSLKLVVADFNLQGISFFPPVFFFFSSCWICRRRG